MNAHRAAVLIVEDIPALAASYSAFLSREPIAVHTAQSGQEALAFPSNGIRCRSRMVDVHLPDMNGLEILRRVRALGAPTDVIVITAEGSVKLAVEAMRSRRVRFIVKPCSQQQWSFR